MCVKQAFFFGDGDIQLALAKVKKNKQTSKRCIASLESFLELDAWPLGMEFLTKFPEDLHFILVLKYDKHCLEGNTSA